jgi:hypothetical protein
MPVRRLLPSRAIQFGRETISSDFPGIYPVGPIPKRGL